MIDPSNKIEAAFRAAVPTTPYSSISVTALCEQAGISRKLFYRRFRGKDDVLHQIFARDVTDPLEELCHLLPLDKSTGFAKGLERRMFAAVLADGAFYRSVVECERGGREAFLRSSSSSFYSFNRVVLDGCGFAGSEADASGISWFFADGKAHMLLRWVAGDFHETADEMADLYLKATWPFWHELIS